MYLYYVMTVAEVHEIPEWTKLHATPHDIQCLPIFHKYILLYMAEPPPHSEHQVLGGVEVVETIAYMQDGTTGDIHFKGKQLIHAAEIALCINHISPDTEVDGKIRHHELCTGRKAESHLTGSSRTGIFQIVNIVNVRDYEIGTAVVDPIE